MASMQTDSLVLALGSPGRKFCVHTNTYMQMHAHAHVAVPRPRAGHFFPRCAFHERQGVEGTVFRGIRGRAGGAGRYPLTKGLPLHVEGARGTCGRVRRGRAPLALPFGAPKLWRRILRHKAHRTGRGAYAARRPRRPGYARAPSPVWTPPRTPRSPVPAPARETGHRRRFFLRL